MNKKDSDLKKIVREITEAKNKNDAKKLRELFDPNFVGYISGIAQKIGREEYIKGIETLHQGFSDIKFVIEDMIEEGNKIAVRLLITGKHSGIYLGHEASHHAVKYYGIVMKRIVNGKTVEEWQVNDSLTMLHQIGLSVNHII